MKMIEEPPVCNRASAPPSRHGGFALIATLSVTALIVLLVLALLSLANQAQKTGRASLRQAEAQANARMALGMALAELQEQTGPDTRVTARADILDGRDASTRNRQSPPVLGVWRSWQGDNHESSGLYAGRPVSPGNYPDAKKTRFRGWLVSGANKIAPDSTVIPDATPGTGKITLVGDRSVGDAADRKPLQVHLAPQMIAGTSPGAFAWWVSGENLKARLPKPYTPDRDTVAGWAAQAKCHSTADPEPFRMDTVIANPVLADKSPNPGQADLFTSPGAANLPVSREFFHDLSTASGGLLTNTATGGWRKDLSLLTENWSLLAKSGLPFFRVKPGQDLACNLPTPTNPKAARSLIYPWSNYGSPTGLIIYELGAVNSWESLANFATLYKKMPALNYQHTDFGGTASGDQQRFHYLHRVRMLPLIARIQWVYSYYATDPPVGAPAGTLEPKLLVTPVFTLWNPFNVPLTYDIGAINDLGGTSSGRRRNSLTFWQRKTLPNAFRYTVGADQNTRYHSFLGSLNNTPPSGAFADTKGGPFKDTLVYSIKSSFTLKPGQTLLFSPAATPVAPSEEVVLQPGYRPGGGHYFPIKREKAGLPDNGQQIIASSSASFKADASFDSTYNDGSTGVGVYFDVLTTPYANATGEWRERVLAYRMVVNPTTAAALYPPIGDLAATTLSEAKSRPQPFLTTVFGIRTASHTMLAGKGFVQTSPLNHYSEMGKAPAYPGDAHPINCPFDYSYAKLSPLGDSLTPNTDADFNGFIITGFQKADGLARCNITELPHRPLHSLAELTHWDLRYDNYKPPFAYNIIANSDATPLLPSNAVINPENAAFGQLDLQHDDSYCANHLLFDDWFVSSIAPNPANLGAPQAGETLKKTYEDWLKSVEPLPNVAYRALPADRAEAAKGQSNLDVLFNREVNTANAWKTIASRVEVDGMFNVNSTSETAWRALLGHARNQKVPYFNAQLNPVLSAKQNYAISRTSVAGDVESKLQGTSGDFPSAAEFAGYRVYNDAQLDRLAKQIVWQVKQRGPFLSLAEFVNRQLTTGATTEKNPDTGENENLAIAGVVQAALNALAKDTTLNPYKEMQRLSKAATVPPPGGNPAYKFADAAKGYNAYGLPGWTRQADVLRPLAPILSARDDTFTIRVHGDSRDGKGNIAARAVCEAVVRRTREYVDPADAADGTGLPAAASNLRFGRRYQIVSFRWLSPSEI